MRAPTANASSRPRRSRSRRVESSQAAPTITAQARPSPSPPPPPRYDALTNEWARTLTSSDIDFYMTVGLPPRDEWPFTQFEPVLDSRPYSQHVKAKSFSHCYACDGARAHKWSGDALACHTCGYAR